MKEKKDQNRAKNGRTLILSMILVFGILAAVVFSLSRSISTEMLESAISNLSESLKLLKGTIEVILKKESEFQKLIAQELAVAEDPDFLIRTYSTNNTMVKLSLIHEGETEGISNTGNAFTAEGLEFPEGKTVEGLPVSKSYVNDMGTWAYTIKCPVTKNGKEIAVLYIEYNYDSFDEALPNRFYNSNATLYLMDGESERFVLKPTGVGERVAGHMNLTDFYRANRILEEELQKEIDIELNQGRNVMFYHDIQNKESLIYMWAVNDGSLYLIGFVPVEAIQSEGRAVNQNIAIVVAVMLTAFLICCLLYALNQRQQIKLRREQEREREIHNRQLGEALHAAQIASNSKTTFLSNMSHDIRTPMNAILGFTTLLGKDADNPEKVREYTKKITASGNHLLSLINDVLDVSKIESGKVVLTIDEFTLNNMISSVDAIIRPMAEARRQQFEVTVTGVNHELLLGDETRLNQILINLLSNAVKYTQEGGSIWLRIIGMEQHSPQYEHFRIEVEDNGYGMTPEFMETIFDAFTRAENSTTNKVQGTGLGMAITKNIVELMGGTINVASREGEGTIFTVELELRLPKEKKDRQFWQHKGIFRILAVDQDEEICQGIQMLMEQAGVAVEYALNGEEGIRKLRQAYEQGQEYQTILLDWKLPGMGCLETARQIRALTSEYIPILFLTSSDQEGTEEEKEAAASGVCGFLEKPFFVSALEEKLQELLTGPDGSEPEEIIEEGALIGMHFLVAEDNEINAEILTELLGIEEADCEIMENGRLAVECFNRAEPGTFDAILMDVQMPVMNGYEATRAIRSLEREDAKTIPIIAMTANAFAEDVKDAMDAGMDAHVAKPVDMELLKKTVCRLIRGGK